MDAIKLVIVVLSLIVILALVLTGIGLIVEISNSAQTAFTETIDKPIDNSPSHVVPIPQSSIIDVTAKFLDLSFGGYWSTIKGFISIGAVVLISLFIFIGLWKLIVK